MIATARRALLAAIAAGALTIAGAEVRAQVAAPPSAPAGLRVFLDCEFCDFDYIRVEIPWVAYVRDRSDADVHVLATRIGTGGGGSRYTINFVGLGAFTGRSDTLEYISQPTDLKDAVRAGVTRTIQLGLVPYAARATSRSGCSADCRSSSGAVQR